MSPRRPSPLVAAILAETRTIKRALRYVGVPATDVPDLTQEILVKLWLAAMRSTEPLPLEGLAWVISHRAARDWNELRHRREQREGAERARAAEIEVPSPHEQVEAREDLLALKARVTPDEWTLLVGAADGETSAEAGERLDCPPATAWTRLRRARNRLARRK